MPQKRFNELAFIELLIGFIFVWIIATFWILFIKNFFFEILGLKEDSTTHSLAIAITLTILFLLLMYLVGHRQASRLERELSSGGGEE